MATKIKLFYKLNFLFILFFLFSHCTPQLAVGTASTAIAVSKEERTLGEFVDDTLIKAQIKNLYFDTNENIFFNIHSDYFEKYEAYSRRLHDLRSAHYFQE